MKITLFLGLTLLLVTRVFSLQNSPVVDVNFLAWTFTTSLALVIFAAMGADPIGGWAVSSALRLRSGGDRK